MYDVLEFVLVLFIQFIIQIEKPIAAINFVQSFFNAGENVLINLSVCGRMAKWTVIKDVRCAL
jgi:hypothetical protein